VRNVEFMVRKNKEEYDTDSGSFKQETTIRFKTIQDDFNMRMESREEKTYKTEMEIRGIMRENEEKLLQLQTYTKNYIEKILENHELVSQSFMRFSGETQINISQLESGAQKFERYISEINDKIHQMSLKTELEKVNKKVDEGFFTFKQEVAVLNENQGNHGKSLETIYKVMSDNKKFLEYNDFNRSLYNNDRLKFALVDDLANKSVNHSFEIENSWAEIKWLKDKY